MNLSKHKKWINDYFNKNYGCVPVLRSALELDNECNFVVEAWDSRLNLWKEQVPFMKKDKFCKTVEVGSDRDGSYCHYKFVFPFDHVDSHINKEMQTKNVEQDADRLHVKSSDSINASRLVGRKLYLRWSDHMYVAIEKIPDGDKKLVEMDIAGCPDIMLCNIYEDGKTGRLSEEILGRPSNDKTGYKIDTIFTNPEFWKTPVESNI